MYGAICGDIIGSFYCNTSNKYQSNGNITVPAKASFADNTVLMAAMCDVLMENNLPSKSLFAAKNQSLKYALQLKHFYIKYPHVGFDELFASWAKKIKAEKQSSYSVSAACHVLPIAYAYDDMEEALNQAEYSCFYSHHHPDAIVSSQAVIAAAFISLCGGDKLEIKQYIERHFDYNLSIPLISLKKNMIFDSRAVYTVPPALICFIESTDYESAIHNALYIGGDTSATACIAGGLAEAFYKKIPDHILKPCMETLDTQLHGIFEKFNEKYVDL